MTRSYTYKPRKGIPSNPFMRGNDFLQKLKEAPTVEQKRALIAESNPFIYALGTKLIPATPKTLEEYADYIKRIRAMHKRLGMEEKSEDSKAIQESGN
jgi:hypothetical protein